jgi:ribosomal protein L11 methylase PrmA
VALIEWVLTAPQSLVETVTDALVDELGALSVSVEDADADLPEEQALFGEPGMAPPPPGWQRSTVIALFVIQMVRRLTAQSQNSVAQGVSDGLGFLTS